MRKSFSGFSCCGFYVPKYSHYNLKSLISVSSKRDVNVKQISEQTTEATEAKSFMIATAIYSDDVVTERSYSKDLAISNFKKATDGNSHSETTFDECDRKRSSSSNGSHWKSGTTIRSLRADEFRSEIQDPESYSIQTIISRDFSAESTEAVSSSNQELQRNLTFGNQKVEDDKPYSSSSSSPSSIPPSLRPWCVGLENLN